MRLKPSIFSVTQVHRIVQYNVPTRKVIFDNRIFTTPKINNNNTSMLQSIIDFLRRIIHG